MTATTTPDYQQPIEDWHRPLANATFHTADTVDDAVSLAAEHEESRYLAGGTALVRLGSWGGSVGPALVYLGRIEELKNVIAADGGYDIGSQVVNGRLITSAQLLADAPLLGEAARSIAGTAVRNLGTIGGNAAIDGSLGPALVALDGTLTIRSTGGDRTIAYDAFAAGEDSADDEHALITQVRVRTDLPDQSYRSVLGASAAVAMQLDGDVCAEVRVGLGGLDLLTRRLTEAEDLLRGQTLTDELVAQVGQIAYRSASGGQDADGDFDFVCEIARVMTERAVDAAAGRPVR